MIRRTILPGGVALLSLFLLLLLFLVSRDVTTTFKVAAQTEGIAFYPRDAPTSRLPLRRALITNHSVHLPDSVDGSFEMADSVRVFVSRVALGPLGIRVESLDGESSAGELFDASDEWVADLGPVVEISLPEIEARASAGENIVIPFTGHVDIGIGPTFQTNVTAPLLRSGKVSLVRRTIFGGQLFEAGTRDLEAGDRFFIREPLTPVSGFIVADERPALNGVFTVQARTAQISRGTETHNVSVSWVESISHDPLATGLWAILGYLLIQPVGALLGMWVQSEYDKRKAAEK